MTSATKLVSVTSVTAAMFAPFPSASARNVLHHYTKCSEDVPSRPQTLRVRQYGGRPGRERPQQIGRGGHPHERADDAHRGPPAHPAQTPGQPPVAFPAP